MRGLEKSYIKREQTGHRHTSRLYERIGLRANSSKIYFFILNKRIDKVVDLVGRGSVIKGNTLCSYIHKSNFHQLGPLGRVGLVVTKSVCLSVCLSVGLFIVPFPCNFLPWSDWCRVCLVHGLVQS